MPSLANIPEPTTACRAQNDAPAEHVSPLATGLALQSEQTPGNIDPATGQPDRAEHQIDSVSCVLLLLIAGALLRVVLGMLGPAQNALPPEQTQYLVDRANAVLNGDPSGAFPLFDLLGGSLINLGLPAWTIALLGSLLMLGAIPSAYIVGRAMTGRRLSGVIGAALVAVHPAALTAAVQLTPSALALGLVTIGLALLCYAPKRGQAFTVGGAICLALAGLAAPLCWVVALMAVPFVFRSQLNHGTGQASRHALLCILIALAPVVGFRAAFLGSAPEQLLVELDATQTTHKQLPPSNRLLITMTDPSLTELGESLHLPLADAGRLTVQPGVQPVPTERRDVVADVLADAWLLMNAGLAALATLSIGVMLARRRLFETLLLVAPLAALAFCALPPGEALRLPMLALVGILSVGLFARSAVPVLDEQAKAEKAAKKAANAASREEKARAKQDRLAEKQKKRLYAFDQPDRREKRSRKKARGKADRRAASDDEPALGILSERTEQPAPISTRPI